MFAVAVWDDARKVGILARDRMGKKPLYYYEHRGALYFASEIKALLRIPGFERRINLEALHHYLSYKHVPHPLSIFEGVRMLPPAHLLVYRPGRAPEIPNSNSSRRDPVLFQENFKLIRAEVGQHELADDQRGTTALARDAPHFRHRGGVGLHVEALVAIAVGVEPFPSLHAPRAPDFDVELERRRHRAQSLSDPPSRVKRPFTQTRGAPVRRVAAQARPGGLALRDQRL